MKLSVTVDVEMPPMPDRLKIVSFTSESLDHAFSGEVMYIDVATLDERGIENYLDAYAIKFRQHVADLKNKPAKRKV